MSHSFFDVLDCFIEERTPLNHKQRSLSMHAQTQTKQQGHVTLSTELQFTALVLNFLTA